MISKHKKALIPLILIALTFTFCQINLVQAQDDVDLGNWHEALAEQLSIDNFSAGILASILFVMPFLIPLLIWDRGKHPIISVLLGIGLLSFCVALGWLSVWVLSLMVFVVALMLGAKFKGLIH